MAAHTMRRRNPARAKRAWVRGFHSEAFVEWTREQPCVACGRGPCEVAHIKSRGAGGRAWDCVPLCAICHREQHTIGVLTFARLHTLDLTQEAAEHWSRWEAQGVR